MAQISEEDTARDRNRRRRGDRYTGYLWSCRVL